jgi:hypothetical protein
VFRGRFAHRACRSLWLSGSIAACSALLAACGGDEQTAPPEPRIPREVAEPLAARADRVASLLSDGDECGAQREAATLVDATVAAVNNGDVPAELQEELVGTANDLAGRIDCVEALPPTTTETEVDDEEDDKDEKDEEDDEDDEDEKEEEQKDEAEEEKDGNDKGKGRGKEKKD